MKINFTKKEFKLLLDLLAIGEWVLYAQEVGDKETEYKKLISKICSYAKDFGVEDLVYYNEQTKRFSFNDNMFEKIYEKIEKFTHEEFWEILEDRLARRDLKEKFGIENYNNLDDMEKFKLIEKYKEKYMDEFYENGIKNLRLFGK